MAPITALIILDGFGCSSPGECNAACSINTQNINRLMSEYPNTSILASGEAVGLPKGQMGNSEVGHLNLGAGRIVFQEFSRITNAIEDGTFFNVPAFLEAVNNCKAHNSSLHLMGLCSDGGVHSHLMHLYALLKLANENGLTKVFIHCFMDGRDVPPKSGRDYILELENELYDLGCGHIATVMGRYYAMDRDRRYDRVKLAYDALVLRQGNESENAAEAVLQSYESGITDEFIKPIVITGFGDDAKLKRDDSVIFYNFRPDRAREITAALIKPDFNGFEREHGHLQLCFVSMTKYDEEFEELLQVAFSPEPIKNTLGEYLAGLSLRQLRIAETEKYAHVTFFFNGGIEAPYPGEDRVLIPSPDVATYDLKPSMSAYETAEEAVKRINSGAYDVMILNFANPDMVGHTGILSAAVEAVRAVDECMGIVVSAILESGGSCIVTADHGNCEQMKDPATGEAFTAHTANPVPFILVDPKLKNAVLRTDGKLCDVAPTLLALMKLPVPPEMTGKSIYME